MTVLFANGVRHINGFIEITARDLDAQGTARLIDVRESDEFHGEFGHIPGAEHVPLATLATVADGWDRAERLIVVCRSGQRSGSGVGILRSKGFVAVANLQGGMMAYRGQLEKQRD